MTLGNDTSEKKAESGKPYLESTNEGLKDALGLADLKLDALSKMHIYGYGLGHFLNDLCAACWFNYLLYYLKSVQPIGSPEEAGTYAGIVLLAGQLADGIFTPIVGYFSDKFDTRCGKRMPWYYFGFVTVVISFYFIFIPCQFCKWFEDTTAVRLFYYVTFPSLFNVGWAACQVSHMSLVPSLTISRVRRDVLNNLRNTFTFVANLWVLLFAFFLFAAVEDKGLKFQILSQGTLLLGALASIFFMWTIREKELTRACRKLAKEYKMEYSKIASQVSLPKSLLDTQENEDMKLSGDESQFGLGNRDPEEAREKENQLTANLLENSDDAQQTRERKQSRASSARSEAFAWYSWFYEWQFYAYGLVYMGARVYCNVTTSLLLFYLNTVLMFGSDKQDDNDIPVTFAIIPMLIYLSSSILTIKLKTIYQKIGRKKTYAVGALLVFGLSVAMIFLQPGVNFLMFGFAVLIGFAQSLILNTAVAYISEVVGQKGGSGAFVYGFYSLLEKVACGLLLFFIMHLRDVDDFANSEYVRWCFAITPLLGVAIAWIGVQTGGASDYDDNAGDAVGF
eukprot:CAMPEP_0176430812 /NCGR_PEP_ID=MMETSP0127-20121128/14459_1 /TAXON_ID=938130 /ORGANISM="Platyophrya macrostoma, Strain WH" /LENGTH=564 /DNA_ID=CAMNT_0017812739 /DNA_START=18 /DNA_END=1712 /DNA_ORIENTATION=-